MIQFTRMQGIARASARLKTSCGGLLIAVFSVVSPLLATDLPVFNGSFEEGFEEETKISNWLLVNGPEGTWGRWAATTGNLMPAEGNALLFVNGASAVAVQLLKDAPITPGKYVFSMQAAFPENVSARGVQIAVYAIPTTDEKEAKFTLLGEKSAATNELSAAWKTLEVPIDIPEGSPHLGHYFQINITSGVTEPNAPLPAQVDVDDVKAKRLEQLE